MATTEARAEGDWSGDLRDFTMAAWCERSDLAAVVVTVDGQARGWVNLCHAGSPSIRAHIWLWARWAAAHLPSPAILPAEDLAPLRLRFEQEA